MTTQDFMGNSWDVACPGCSIAGGSLAVPGGLIARTNYFCVHQDPLVPLPGFIVVASIRHIRSVLEMAEPEYVDFVTILRRARSAIASVASVDSVTFVQEERSAHFHAWLFPWTEQLVRVYGQPSLTKIRGIMDDVRQKPLLPDQLTALESCIVHLRNELGKQ